MQSPFRDPRLTHSSAPRLETERLVLRQFRAEDIEYFAEAFADEEVTRFVGGRNTREDAWRKMLAGAGFWSLTGLGMWAAERKSDGRTVGHFGFFDFQRDMEPSIAGEPEMGWILCRDGWGKGYGTEAGKRILDWFDATFGAVSVVAIIDRGNDASMNLAERLGFVRQQDAMYRGEPIGFFRRSPTAAAASAAAAT